MSTTTVEAQFALEPGWHDGVPHETYLAMDMASSHRLGKLLKSPAHLKAALEHPESSSPALHRGRALHAAVLEPDLFEDNFVCGPPGDRRTKAVKDAWAALEGHYGDGFVLTSDEYAMCLNVREAVARHPTARALLRIHPGKIERTGVFFLNGVLCKIRPDFSSVQPGALARYVVDLKSTADAGADDFALSYRKYNYWIQEAFYRLGCEYLGTPVEDFFFLAVEKSAPYAINVLTSEPSDRAWAQSQVLGLLDIYKKCVAKNEWPGYSPTIKTMELPGWFKSQLAKAS